jgi:hypothetical protein
MARSAETQLLFALALFPALKNTDGAKRHNIITFRSRSLSRSENALGREASRPYGNFIALLFLRSRSHSHSVKTGLLQYHSISNHE